MTAEPATYVRMERFRSFVFEAAPKLAAGAAFLAGALTLLTVATPALEHVGGLDFAERLVNEMPELTASIVWAQAQGLRTFDLGMAPLSGMAEDQYASLFARIALRLVHDHGEPFYGFKGLETFKDKFGPRWEPRYIAAPGTWTLPLVLAEVARLTDGARR